MEKWIPPGREALRQRRMLKIFLPSSNRGTLSRRYQSLGLVGAGLGGLLRRNIANNFEAAVQNDQRDRGSDDQIRQGAPSWPSKNIRVPRDKVELRSLERSIVTPC